MEWLDYLGSILQSNFKSHFPNLFLEMLGSNISLPGHPRIALDFIGFFIPLAVSVVLLVVSWKVRPELSPRKKKNISNFYGTFYFGGINFRNSRGSRKRIIGNIPDTR